MKAWIMEAIGTVAAALLAVGVTLCACAIVALVWVIERVERRQ